ncbi:hypothetical protein AN640_07620, partial [Candidatus Epulonipiscium fishelsonii]
LNPHLRNIYGIKENDIFIEEQINAKELVTHDRIDLIAKIKYVEHLDKGYDMEFATELYKKHIEAFSLGSFNEGDLSGKTNFDAYLTTFNQLIFSIKNHKFDKNISVVPVDSKGTIIDGAHRTAIAAYYNMDITIIRLNISSKKYGAKFFKDRLLDVDMLDYMILEYCKFKSNTYFICVWPIVNKQKLKYIEKYIKHRTKIVYKKKINLNYNGLKYFIIQIYSHQSWIGSIDDKYKGTKSKVRDCFSEGSSLYGYVVEIDNFNDLLELKQVIRQLMELGNNSIHSSDNQKETIEMGQILLNNNSIHLLNYGNPYLYKNFIKKVTVFKNLIYKSKGNIENTVIDSSSILGLYGLREPSDIDFLSNDPTTIKIKNKYIDNHNKYLNYYKGYSLDNLIFNPKKLFIFYEHKIFNT